MVVQQAAVFAHPKQDAIFKRHGMFGMVSEVRSAISNSGDAWGSHCICLPDGAASRAAADAVACSLGQDRLAFAVVISSSGGGRAAGGDAWGYHSICWAWWGGTCDMQQ